MANEQNGDLQMNPLSDPQMLPGSDPKMAPGDPSMNPAESDPKMDPKTKPGWKTSEFWLTLLAQLFPIIESFAGKLKPEWAALFAAAAQAVYTYQRYKIKTQ